MLCGYNSILSYFSLMLCQPGTGLTYVHLDRGSRALCGIIFWISLPVQSMKSIVKNWRTAIRNSDSHSKMPFQDHNA
ncbi:hypothetical protein BDV34DRAFT_184207 [Aspergillus parasiticus]|uniref:Uncharacterized protein n=1 Tax=Aspergillus parasiticus TaxID=5067 RepID=A0A5N6E5A2_ASPPA|nr:hypothetical protein BDV34DRAFT_184207 [Aspergillus parasiticus]